MSKQQPHEARRFAELLIMKGASSLSYQQAHVVNTGFERQYVSGRHYQWHYAEHGH